MAKFTLKGNDLLLPSSSKVAYVKGNDILLPSSSKVASISDVKRDIQGATGSMTDVALWWFFVHKP